MASPRESGSLEVDDLSSEEQLRWGALVAELSTGLIAVAGDRIDAQIERCLGRIIEALGLDRSTLLQVSDGGKDMVATHSVAAPGFAPFPRASMAEHAPWALLRVLAGERFFYSRIDDLPDVAATDKATIRQYGPKSNVTMPLLVNGQIIGALCFGSMRAERSWSPAFLDRLQVVGDVMSSALARKRSDAQLRDALGQIERLRDRLANENDYLRTQVRAVGGAARLVGTSRAIQKVVALVERVAPTGASVLISGETGVGKELVAEAIHAGSSRADRTIVKLNCAALPASLIEAELFGRERGAYTGALTRQAGRFELADGSTLFLDEVSELPLDLQAKLLRVLQDGELQRLGGSRTIRVDARIVAATNVDLESAIAEGRFRADLYYRLAVFPIDVPPLRERLGDLPHLGAAIVDEVAPKLGKRITAIADESLARLQQYPWPGNVRELKNLIERAIILSDGPMLRIDLPEHRRAGRLVGLALEDVERQHVVYVLGLAGWRIRGPQGAAAMLGLPPTTLETRMAKLGIRRPERAV